MTEVEWLAATDPAPMLEWLRQSGRLSDRKARLFGCSCVRTVWLLLTDRFQNAVEIAERFADGLATKADLLFASTYLVEVTSRVDLTAKTREASFAAWALLSPDEGNTGDRGYVERAIERVALATEGQIGVRTPADILRHLVGNPFAPQPVRQPVPEVVLRLAEALYDGTYCAPQLNDALLEAGMGEMAAHFEVGEHPKGCAWLDLLLGRS